MTFVVSSGMLRNIAPRTWRRVVRGGREGEDYIKQELARSGNDSLPMSMCACEEKEREGKREGTLERGKERRKERRKEGEKI